MFLPPIHVVRGFRTSFRSVALGTFHCVAGDIVYMFVTRRTVRRFLRLASTKDAAWTCTYESPRGRGLSVLWGGRPAGFAGLCVTLFHCLSSCRTVSRSGCPVWRSHWQRLQIPTLPHPLQLPLLSGSWIPARRGGMKWYFTVVLVCVFLGMSDVR